jgi:hypothetical protein
MSEPVHVMYSNNGRPFQCSAYCPACAPDRERRARAAAFASALAPFETLFRNLRDAGALCAAFSDGVAHEGNFAPEWTWHPGCGRQRP